MGGRSREKLLIGLLLGIGTLVVYWRAMSCGFVNYDDSTYTGHPLIRQGLTWPGIEFAFTGTLSSNWHPLTILSHMLDAQIFGASPVGPHAVNILFHIANTILLFLVLTRMTGSAWKSGFVAGLFAIHPVHVESVAWVAERKDVLSTFFWMLTMWMYVRYTERPGLGAMLGVAGIYALGLMAKPMLVTLPFVLLLLDYWPLGRSDQSSVISGRRESRGAAPERLSDRSRNWRLVLEKWPLFLLAVVSSAVTYYVQHKGGAGVTLVQVPLLLRFWNAATAYIMYMQKMLWPSGLAVFYPYPTSIPALWKPLGALILLGAGSYAAFRWRERFPYLPVGWLWFLGTLIPVIGLVQVGQQAMADRYTYVPLIGLFIIVAWGIPGSMGAREYGSVGVEEKGRKGDRGKGRKGEKAAPAPVARTDAVVWSAAGGIVLLALAVCTFVQIGYWKDRLTLFSHALDVTQGNFVAHDMVGVELSERGKDQEALTHFQQSIELNADDDIAYNGAGNAYTHLGRLEDAIGAYEKAIEIRPDFPLSYLNLGLILIVEGRIGEAIERFESVREINQGVRGHPEMFTGNLGKNQAGVRKAEEVLQRRPNDPAARCALALTQAQAGDLDGAIDQLSRVARMNVSSEELRTRLQAAVNRKPADAVAQGRGIVKKRPNDPVAHYFLGNALNAQGQRTEAIRELQTAIRLKPDFGEAHNNLAVVYYFTGDYAGAWREIHATEKCGTKVNPNFVAALTQRMPDPGE